MPREISRLLVTNPREFLDDFLSFFFCFLFLVFLLKEHDTSLADRAISPSETPKWCMTHNTAGAFVVTLKVAI